MNGAEHPIGAKAAFTCVARDRSRVLSRTIQHNTDTFTR